MDERIKAHVIYGAPGTGKTTYLMQLCDKLKDRFFANQILYLSFTRAARDEVFHRIYKKKTIKRPLKSEITPQTLHSLAYSYVEEATPETIVKDKRLREFCKTYNITSKNNLLQIMQRAENSLCGIADAISAYVPCGLSKQYKAILKQYEDWKAINEYIDFNDLLVLFMNRKFDGLSNYRVLIVDEAQDLTPLQWQCIRYLIENYSLSEIYIAGDDDQAIYAWAGADSQAMFAFEKEFKATRVVLNKSYRLPAKIKDLADRLIKRIPETRRVHKDFESNGLEKGEIEKHFSTVALPIKPEEETLILYRENSARRLFEETLQRKKLPYISTDGKRTWFNDFYANAIRAYKKKQNGQDITEKENKLLSQYATEAPFDTDKEWHEALNIPFERFDYYKSIDLNEKPKIRLSTIHCAKGMEAETVILYKNVSRKVLKNMYKNQLSMDNEIRVFYVGITRAKKKLHLISNLAGSINSFFIC